MGVTNLNTRHGMVEILESEHSFAKKVRFDFVKYSVITGALNAILSGIVFCLLGSYIHSAIHFFAVVAIFTSLIRDTVKQMNLKSVSGIIFDNLEYQNYANAAQVYETTRELCRMTGFIMGRRSIVNLIHLFTIISIMAEIIEFVVKII